MRACFVTDLHGHAGLYEQLRNLVRAERPRLLILGGDMHAECDPANPQGSQVAFVRQELTAQLAAWRAAAPGLEVIAVAGNHDLKCTYAALVELDRAGGLVLLDHRQSRQVAGLTWLGLCLTPPTPFWLKDFERLDRPGDALPNCGGAVWDEAARRLREVGPADHFPRHPTLQDELGTVTVPAEPWIFVCHPPPYASRLDRLPHVPHPVGSHAVRAFIQTRGPRLALHGHCHESPETSGSYRDQIGEALCVNPGQSHDRLYGLLFDTDAPGPTLRHTVLG